MQKKWMLGFLLTTVLISGCNQKEDEKETSKVENDNRFTIVMEKEDKVDMVEIEGLIEEKYGKNVEVKTVSAKEKREMMIEGEADIILLSQEEIGFAKDEGLIQEVQFDKSKYLNSAVEALQYEGKQYGIPGSFDVPFYMYNGDIIKEKPTSFDDLKQYQEEKEKTKEVVEENAEEQKDEEIQLTPPYLSYINLSEYQYIDNVLHAFGYNPFVKKQDVYQTSDVKIASKEAKKGFEKIKQWHNELIPNEDISEEKIIELYNDNQLYSFVGHKEQLEGLKGKINISTIPNIENDVSLKPTIEVKGWAVSSNLEDKEIVKDFEKIISNEDYVRRQIEEFFIFIPVKLVEDESVLIRTMYAQAENSYALPILAELKELKTPTKNALEWYLTGKNELDAALKNAEQTIEFEILSNY